MTESDLQAYHKLQYEDSPDHHQIRKQSKIIQTIKSLVQGIVPDDLVAAEDVPQNSNNQTFMTKYDKPESLSKSKAVSSKKLSKVVVCLAGDLTFSEVAQVHEFEQN